MIIGLINFRAKAPPGVFHKPRAEARGWCLPQVNLEEIRYMDLYNKGPY